MRKILINMNCPSVTRPTTAFEELAFSGILYVHILWGFGREREKKVGGW
jgi:hypothetical protein